MGVCGYHWKWLQLHSCNRWCKPVRKNTYFATNCFFTFWKKFLWDSRRWEPPRLDHNCCAACSHLSLIAQDSGRAATWEEQHPLLVVRANNERAESSAPIELKRPIEVNRRIELNGRHIYWVNVSCMYVLLLIHPYRKVYKQKQRDWFLRNWEFYKQ